MLSSIEAPHADLDAGMPAAVAVLAPDDRPLPSPPDILAIELAALTRGITTGHARGLTQGIVALCDVLEIPLDADRLAVMERLEDTHLEALLDAIRADRRWP